MDATKKPNIEITHNHRDGRRTIISSTSSSQAFKRTHEDSCMKKPENPCAVIGVMAAGEGDGKPEQPEAAGTVESGRERLKRHRVEMSGRVWIPDIWGQEDLLKKWIDCRVFDSSLEKSSIMSAREALIQEGRSTLSIENSC